MFGGLRTTPTNVDLGVIIEGQDYDLKVGINNKAQRRAAFWRIPGASG
jgi:hypothetical protein